MNLTPPSVPTIRRDRIAWVAGTLVLLLHLAFAGRYDIFRDELYFIVCGQHPAFGYVDQPPGVPLMAAALYMLNLGAFGLRIPAALAAAALVVLAVRFTRLLGGGRIACMFAALSCAIAPMLMGTTATLNTSTFEALCWTGIAFLLVRAMRVEDNRALLWLGVVVGLTLQIKYAALFWLAGLALGLLAMSERRIVLRPSLWIAVAIAVLIAASSFVWQALNGFPFLELAAAAKAKNADVPLGSFMANQVLVLNPAFAPLWLAGLAAPFLSARLKDLRFVPVACLVVLIIVRAGHGKDYYLAPLYPTLFVIGAVALAPLASRLWGRIALGGMALAGTAFSAVAAPMALPILPPATLAAYLAATGIAPQAQERSTVGTALPQTFADQLGWHDFTAQVIEAWMRIPAERRARTGILVDNYGEAAALDLYAARFGLPPALSGHNQYYRWGLRGQHPVDLLVTQRDPGDLQPFCDHMTTLGRSWSQWAVPHENGKLLIWCEGVHPPLAELWPRLKDFE